MIYLEVFYADVAELDASTDLALAEIMYGVVYKYNVKYVLEGQN